MFKATVWTVFTAVASTLTAAVTSWVVDNRFNLSVFAAALGAILISIALYGVLILWVIS